jgi:ubiquinone/menaquinone biosynthesis C-methylase UbiE
MAISVLDKYQRIAPLYDVLDWPFERRRYRRIRPVLFEGLSGRVLDVGVGTGRNMPFYPLRADVIGIDLSPRMLARAEHRRVALGSRAELRLMDVTKLDFPHASFDAAVASFVFCVLPDDQQPAALRELSRVVKPGGTIRLLEYVRPTGARRFIAKLWAPWMAWAYGAGFDRHTEDHIRAVGLETVSARFVVADLIKLIEIRAAPL